MQIICKWKYHGPNPIVIGIKEGGDEDTHSICPECAAAMRAELREIKRQPMQSMQSMQSMRMFATVGAAA